MQGKTIAALVVSALLFAGLLFVLVQPSRETSMPNPGTGVSIIDGKQRVDLTVKGGYAPRATTAQAGLPTTLRLHTNNTYDCSSAVRIPSLNINQQLPPTGVTDIDLGIAQAGTLEGSCSMGMFPFRVTFTP